MTGTPELRSGHFLLLAAFPWFLLFDLKSKFNFETILILQMIILSLNPKGGKIHHAYEMRKDGVKFTSF